MDVSILFKYAFDSSHSTHSFWHVLFLVLKNSLRGFPLNGCQFNVPETYRGVVFQEDQRPLDENAERTFKAAAVFNEFTYWNYDKQPSENDKLKQALTWNNFAEALHSPITAEDIEKYKD